MRQNMEHGKKKLATRILSFVLALAFVFSIFSGIASAGWLIWCRPPPPFSTFVPTEKPVITYGNWKLDSCICDDMITRWALCGWKKEKTTTTQGYKKRDCWYRDYCKVTEKYETEKKEIITKRNFKQKKKGFEYAGSAGICYEGPYGTVCSCEVPPEVYGYKKCGNENVNITSPAEISRPVISGHLPPSGSVTHLITIDSTVSMIMFIIHWPRSESDLDLVLYSPSIKMIDPSVAAIDPVINYKENTTYEYYLIQTPESGNWTMEVIAVDVPSEGEDYYAIAYQISNITLSLSTDKYRYNPNEWINITANLIINNAPLIGKAVTAEIQRPDGTVDNISLFDDGSHGDVQANDGNYSNAYTNTTLSGTYYIIARATGTTPNSDNFARVKSKSIIVEKLKAKFSDIYSDYGADIDNDGLYDYLIVDIGVNVFVRGNYSLIGWLYDVNGSEIVWAYNDTYIEVGKQTMQLKFDGFQIRMPEVDAPFNLGYLILFGVNDTVAAYRYDAYTTNAYNYTDFQTPLAEFTGNYSDCGTDTDGNGLYNYLTIDVGVNVTAAGDYTIEGGLYDVNGNAIAWAINSTHLDIGNQTVQINFEGKAIQKHGVNGPYYLKNLTLYDKSWNLLNYISVVYTTSEYNYTDFQAPLAELTGDYADYGIDTDGDGLYDYLTIDVGVNVITAGDYSLVGYLYDVNESEIIWSIDYGCLDVGNHTMHLDFDGKTIQKHGVDGPYYFKHLMLSGENWTFIDYIPDAYNTSAYNYTDFVDPVSTENEVTISGVGLGEIRLIVFFTDTIPVFAGRYSYDLVGINIPQRPNNFTITTSEVKNLKVGVKKIQDNTTRIWVTQTIAAPEGIATVQSDLPSPGNYHVKIFGDAAESASEVDLELTAVKKIKASGDFSLSIDISGFPAGKYTVTATADTGCFTDLTLDGLPLVP